LASSQKLMASSFSVKNCDQVPTPDTAIQVVASNQVTKIKGNRKEEL